MSLRQFHLEPSSTALSKYYQKQLTLQQQYKDYRVATSTFTLIPAQTFKSEILETSIIRYCNIKTHTWLLQSAVK